MGGQFPQTKGPAKDAQIAFLLALGVMSAALFLEDNTFSYLFCLPECRRACEIMFFFGLENSRKPRIS